jgi:hypothetical protein
LNPVRTRPNPQVAIRLSQLDPDFRFESR